jgi:hypothetical protein
MGEQIPFMGVPPGYIGRERTCASGCAGSRPLEWNAGGRM